jgi:hypothetical protein
LAVPCRRIAALITGGKTALKTELCEFRHDDLPQHRWRLRRFMPD